MKSLYYFGKYYKSNTTLLDRMLVLSKISEQGFCITDPQNLCNSDYASNKSVWYQTQGKFLFNERFILSCSFCERIHSGFSVRALPLLICFFVQGKKMNGIVYEEATFKTAIVRKGMLNP